MSAFVVVREHIDALVKLAVDGPRDRTRYPGDSYGPRWQRDAEAGWSGENIARATPSNRDDIGEMLVCECVRSVSDRYSDNDDLPGPIDPYYLKRYSYSQLPSAPTAVEGLKLIACYEYQSCEHDGWQDSEAKRFCDALRLAVINCLPGYEDAAWEYSEGQVPA